MKTLRFFIPVFLFYQVSFSQQDSTQKQQDSTSQRTKLNFAISYLSNSVYLGRKDSLKVSYITPGLTLITPSGFFTAAHASFLTQESRIDLFTLEAGYDYNKNNFDAGLSASTFFYNNQSVNVKAELSSSISAYASYLLPFIKPSLSGYISLGSNKPDYTASFGLEHSFVTNEEVFSLTPSFYINAGTQNYYDGYYQNRKFGKGRRGRNVTTTAQVIDASKFKIMDYELLADAEYKVNHFSFYFEPSYAIPVNPNIVVVTVKPQNGTASTQTFTEKISNSFYWTLGVSYNLYFKKHS